MYLKFDSEMKAPKDDIHLLYLDDSSDEEDETSHYSQLSRMIPSPSHDEVDEDLTPVMRKLTVTTEPDSPSKLERSSSELIRSPVKSREGGEKSMMSNIVSAWSMFTKDGGDQALLARCNLELKNGATTAAEGIKVKVDQHDIKLFFLAQSLGIALYHHPQVDKAYRTHKKKLNVSPEDSEQLIIFMKSIKELVEDYWPEASSMKIDSHIELFNHFLAQWDKLSFKHTSVNLQTQQQSKTDPTAIRKFYRAIRSYDDSHILRTFYELSSTKEPFKQFIDNEEKMEEVVKSVVGDELYVKMKTLAGKDDKLKKIIIKFQVPLFVLLHASENTKSIISEKNVKETIETITARRFLLHLNIHRFKHSGSIFNRNLFNDSLSLITCTRLIKRLTTRHQLDLMASELSSTYQGLDSGSEIVSTMPFLVPNLFSKKNEYIVLTNQIVAKLYYFFDYHSILGCRPFTLKFKAYKEVDEKNRVIFDQMPKLRNSMANKESTAEVDKDLFPFFYTFLYVEGMRLPAILIINQMLVDLLDIDKSVIANSKLPIDIDSKKHSGIEAIRDSIKKKQSAMKKLEKSLPDEEKKAEKLKEDLQQQITECEKNIAKAKQELPKDNIDALKKTYEEAKGKIDSLQEERKNLSLKLIDKPKKEEIDVEIKTIKEKIKKIEVRVKEIKSVKYKLGKLEKQLNTSNERLAKNNKEIEVMRDKLKTSKQNIIEEEKRVQSINLSVAMPIAFEGAEKYTRALTKFLARYMPYHYGFYGNKADKIKGKALKSGAHDQSSSDTKTFNSTIIKLCSYIIQQWLTLVCKINIDQPHESVKEISELIVNQGIFKWYPSQDGLNEESEQFFKSLTREA